MEATRDKSTKPRARVLLVDDDPEVLSSLSIILREEFSVLAVESCAAGRASLQNQEF